MITINATGDTTLHTAGKYCPEDILVKVPAGGSSGGASVETCTFTFTGESSNYYPKYISYMTINESGVITTIEETCSSSSVTVNCLCDSIVVVQTNGGALFSAEARCELLYTKSSLAVFHIVAGNGQKAIAGNGFVGGGNA